MVWWCQSGLGAMVNGLCGPGRGRMDLASNLPSLNTFQYFLQSKTQESIMRVAMYMFSIKVLSQIQPRIMMSSKSEVIVEHQCPTCFPYKDEVSLANISLHNASSQDMHRGIPASLYRRESPLHTHMFGHI